MAGKQFGAAGIQFGAAEKQFGATGLQFGVAGMQLGAAKIQFGAAGMQLLGWLAEQQFGRPRSQFVFVGTRGVNML